MMSTKTAPILFAILGATAAQTCVETIGADPAIDAIEGAYADWVVGLCFPTDGSEAVGCQKSPFGWAVDFADLPNTADHQGVYASYMAACMIGHGGEGATFENATSLSATAPCTEESELAVIISGMPVCACDGGYPEGTGTELAKRLADASGECEIADADESAMTDGEEMKEDEATSDASALSDSGEEASSGTSGATAISIFFLVLGLLCFGGICFTQVRSGATPGSSDSMGEKEYITKVEDKSTATVTSIATNNRSTSVTTPVSPMASPPDEVDLTPGQMTA